MAGRRGTVDHDTGRLVWARPGRDAAVVHAFLDELGPQRIAQLTHVSADAAPWIHGPFRERAPQAVLRLDPFHVVAWATDAVEAVRRRLALRVLTRRAYGYHSPQALIAHAMLTRGGLRPDLPGRAA